MDGQVPWCGATLVLSPSLLRSPWPVLTCRSAIHGRGLFCKRNIDAGEMVIEYSGIVIRSVLTDKREKFYDGKVGSVGLWERGGHSGAGPWAPRAPDRASSPL